MATPTTPSTPTTSLNAIAEKAELIKKMQTMFLGVDGVAGIESVLYMLMRFDVERYKLLLNYVGMDNILAKNTSMRFLGHLNSTNKEKIYGAVQFGIRPQTSCDSTLIGGKMYFNEKNGTFHLISILMETPKTIHKNYGGNDDVLVYYNFYYDVFERSNFPDKKGNGVMMLGWGVGESPEVLKASDGNCNSHNKSSTSHSPVIQFPEQINKKRTSGELVHGALETNEGLRSVMALLFDSKGVILHDYVEMIRLFSCDKTCEYVGRLRVHALHVFADMEKYGPRGPESGTIIGSENPVGGLFYFNNEQKRLLLIYYLQERVYTKNELTSSLVSNFTASEQYESVCVDIFDDKHPFTVREKKWAFGGAFADIVIYFQNKNMQGWLDALGLNELSGANKTNVSNINAPGYRGTCTLGLRMRDSSLNGMAEYEEVTLRKIYEENDGLRAVCVALGGIKWVILHDYIRTNDKYVTDQALKFIGIIDDNTIAGGRLYYDEKNGCTHLVYVLEEIEYRSQSKQILPERYHSFHHDIICKNETLTEKQKTLLKSVRTR
jgi:hypothetical protein